MKFPGTTPTTLTTPRVVSPDSVTDNEMWALLQAKQMLSFLVEQFLPLETADSPSLTTLLSVSSSSPFFVLARPHISSYWFFLTFLRLSSSSHFFVLVRPHNRISSYWFFLTFLRLTSSSPFFVLVLLQSSPFFVLVHPSLLIFRSGVKFCC